MVSHSNKILKIIHAMLLVNNLDRSLSYQNNNFCIVEILIFILFGKNKLMSTNIYI